MQQFSRFSRKSTDQKYSVDHQDERHCQAVEWQTLAGGTAISGGGLPDTGCRTPFQPVLAEFKHWHWSVAHVSTCMRVESWSISSGNVWYCAVLLSLGMRSCPQWSNDVIGWVASWNGSLCQSPGCQSCTSVFYASRQPVQLRFRSFHLAAGEYVEIRRGATTSDHLIGRFTSSHRPGRVVEVAGNIISVTFKSVSVHDGLAFNFTFQPKGMFSRLWYFYQLFLFTGLLYVTVKTSALKLPSVEVMWSFTLVLIWCICVQL